MSRVYKNDYGDAKHKKQSEFERVVGVHFRPQQHDEEKPRAGLMRRAEKMETAGEA